MKYSTILAAAIAVVLASTACGFVDETPVSVLGGAVPAQAAGRPGSRTRGKRAGRRRSGHRTC